MTASVKGGADLSRFLGNLAADLEPKILREALRVGAEVIAEGAREGCRSDEVRSSIKTVTSTEPGIVSAKVQTKGWYAYIAPWLEFGTAEHFITVDPELAEGRTARRVNREGGHKSLVIGGKFVGATVHHPGANPYPFMRPALDNREQDAIRAIGEHIAQGLVKTPAVATEPDE